VTTNAPVVGALVRDTKRDRVGVYMGQGGPYAMLRPVGGGLEWQAHPADLRPEVSNYPRPADVEQLRAACQDHIALCAKCGPDAACDIGRRLSLACQDASRAVGSTPQAQEA
jgi:hypothetical protein